MFKGPKSFRLSNMSNYSFSSTSGYEKRFQAVFPDSEIATGYNQNETKSKYTTQYGVFPNLKDLSPEELKDAVFTFRFDESTIQQENKQFDGHAQYWFEKQVH